MRKKVNRGMCTNSNTKQLTMSNSNLDPNQRHHQRYQNNQQQLSGTSSVEYLNDDQQNSLQQQHQFEEKKPSAKAFGQQFSGLNLNQHDEELLSTSEMCATQLTETINNSIASDVTTNVNIESTCSSALIYKMKTHGKHNNEHSPTRVEFNRVKQVSQEKAFFLFRKPEPTRFKYVAKKSTLPNSKKHLLKESLKKQKQNDDVTVNCSKKLNYNYGKSSYPDGKKSNQQQEIIEIYQFDHGNWEYFSTTDYPPHLASDKLARQTTDFATKFWAEIYGSIHILFAFLIAFLLQTVRFFMYSIVRPLIVGIPQIVGDYFFKPALTTSFNGFIQPIILFGKNISLSICEMLNPFAVSLSQFCVPLIDLIRSFRLIEYHNHDSTHERPLGSVNDNENDENVNNSDIRDQKNHQSVA